MYNIKNFPHLDVRTLTLGIALVRCGQAFKLEEEQHVITLYSESYAQHLMHVAHDASFPGLHIHRKYLDRRPEEYPSGRMSPRETQAKLEGVQSVVRRQLP